MPVSLSLENFTTELSYTVINCQYCRHIVTWARNQDRILFLLEEFMTQVLTKRLSQAEIDELILLLQKDPTENNQEVQPCQNLHPLS